MDQCIEALHTAYLDLAIGSAVTRRRSDSLVPSGANSYGLKTMDGIAPSLGVGAVRINSDILSWPKVGNVFRRVKIPAAPGDRFTGVILLFSIKTGEPLAIMPDGVIQRLRVGATSALGMRYLAKSDPCKAAIIGSGWQAGAQLMGLVTIFPEVEKIRVFSPNFRNVDLFCKNWSQQCNQILIRAKSIAEAVKGCDIVLCATNSIDPVFSPNIFETGMHVGSIKPSEIPKESLELADKVYVHLGHSKPDLVQASGLAVPDHTCGRGWTISEEFDFASCPTLLALVSGIAEGRVDDDERTCFVNDLGLGLQFAVVAGLAHKLALDAGLGAEFQTELFTQVEHP